MEYVHAVFTKLIKKYFNRPRACVKAKQEVGILPVRVFTYIARCADYVANVSFG
jgi:hypothetical protein